MVAFQTVTLFHEVKISPSFLIKFFSFHCLDSKLGILVNISINRDCMLFLVLSHDLKPGAKQVIHRVVWSSVGMDN